jgi:hypothetical protein
MRNISISDFILWDSVKNIPVENLDIVYHFTTIFDMINDGFKLKPNEEFKCVASLPMCWQKEISNAIEKTKC